MNDSATKIRRLSKILKIIFAIAACGAPVLTAGIWVSDGFPFLKPWFDMTQYPEMLRSGPALIKPYAELTATTKLLGFLISLIPTTFFTFAFFLLHRLFGLFEKLNFFSQESVLCIRKIGFCLLIGQLVFPFYIGLLSLALSFGNTPGSRFISLGFGTEQMTLTIVALIIILVSWIMNEGRKLQEEHAATV